MFENLFLEVELLDRYSMNSEIDIPKLSDFILMIEEETSTRVKPLKKEMYHWIKNNANENQYKFVIKWDVFDNFEIWDDFSVRYSLWVLITDPELAVFFKLRFID